MSAREQALAAHAERVAATPVEETETYEEARDRERRERYRLSQVLLPQCPPVEWFPGVEWDVMDFGRPGTSDQFEGDGSMFYIAPRERDFTLWVGKRQKPLPDDPPEGAEWEVQFVWRHRATPPYEHEGTYWTGVEVKSAADVGEQLEKRGGSDGGG